MTKTEAEAKAARLTAAGVPTVTNKNSSVRGGYMIRNVDATRAANRRSDATRAINGRQQAYTAATLGRHAIGQRAARARRKAYLAEPFGGVPERRMDLTANRVVVLSDIQIPFEDPPALDQALTVLHSVKPDLVVLNGDIVDCYAESSFMKDHELARASIPETHRRIRVLLDALAHVPQKLWLGGNHEARWTKLLWSKLPIALEWLALHQKAAGRKIDLVDPVASFASLFGADEYGFTYRPYLDRLYLADGNLVVTHGKYVSRHSGQSAKRTLEWLGKSCIVGHTHRLGCHLVTQDGKMHGAFENGCLCQLEPEYDDTPNWQQGFSVVRVNGPEFHVIQVSIVRRHGAPVAVYER